MSNQRDAGDWLLGNDAAQKATIRSRSSDAEHRRVWLTSPELIDRIVRAIELNQSVLLSGPRGCGKSYCIRAAVAEAQRRGILSVDSDLTCQGNREVPRDYLMEDDVVFRLTKVDHSTTHGGDAPHDQNEDPLTPTREDKVVPGMRSAPLFEFAERDSENEPVSSLGTREVRCRIRRGPMERPVKRYSLFLDEINRFSDGVLDGLLSVLEEKVAFLRGRSYKLPVVVLMTMNPPGYDATARNLSPPLAARISRSYQLNTPDLDTLTDLIVKSKMDELQSQVNSDIQDTLRWVGTPEHVVRRRTRTIEIPPILRRRAGLATLLMWGDPREQRPGMEYLTAKTRSLIIDCIDANDSEPNGELGVKLKELSQICRFGPDGRAASDWLTSAAALALQSSEFSDHVLVTDRHCVNTALESLSHKIYDDFSPASEPGKVATKENAVSLVCSLVMDGEFDTLISRSIDDQEFLDSFRSKGFVRVRDSASVQSNQIYEIFTKWRITDDQVVVPLFDAFGRALTPLLSNGDTSSPAFIARLADRLRAELASLQQVQREDRLVLEHHPEGGVYDGTPLFSARVEGTDWRDCFPDSRWHSFFSDLSKLDGPIPEALRAILKTTGTPREDYRVELGKANAVSSNKIALGAVVDIAKREGVLSHSETIRRALDSVDSVTTSSSVEDISENLLAMTAMLNPTQRLSLLYGMRSIVKELLDKRGGSDKLTTFDRQLGQALEQPFSSVILQSSLLKDDVHLANRVLETIQRNKALGLARNIKLSLDYLHELPRDGDVNQSVNHLVDFLSSLGPMDKNSRLQLNRAVHEVIRLHRSELGLSDGFDAALKRELRLG